MDTTYTFTVNQDGSVDITYNQDGVTDHLNGAPLDSLDDLTVYLNTCAQNHINDLEASQPPVIASDITVSQTYQADLATPDIAATMVATPILTPPIAKGV